MGLLGKRVTETIREATDKASAWVRLALGLAIAALAIAGLALLKAARVS